MDHPIHAGLDRLPCAHHTNINEMWNVVPARVTNWSIMLIHIGVGLYVEHNKKSLKRTLQKFADFGKRKLKQSTFPESSRQKWKINLTP